RFAEEIRAFQQQDRARPPTPGGILFTGSSSIRRWDLDRWFPGLGAINRGFGGSHVSDVLHYFDRLITPHQPRTIVFYAGDNDIGSAKPPQRVIQDTLQFIHRVDETLPQARMIYMPIKPSVARWRLWSHIRQVNEALEAHARTRPRLTYADIVAPMLSSEGRPRPELFAEDSLHLSDQGYALWTSIIAPLLGAPEDASDASSPRPQRPA
ncbi:MAG TPA: SGNH/GDSL hydrolase family protein, partial [Phycisphaeraceae bacterium]